MEPFPLWPGRAPGALGDRPQDRPTLTSYPPTAKSTGASVIVFPGGGYGMLAPHEGETYAHWLAAQGMHAWVLHYRLGTHGYRHPTMLNDAARAVRTVRHLARRTALDPARIGVMGSSAGGHLVATIITQFDAGQADAADPVERESSRPDAGILCYPVITMKTPHAHLGSRENLLGTTPNPAAIEALSAEQQVKPGTSPAFIWHTVADNAVPVENALIFAAALRRAGVPFALSLYENGVHGLGLGTAEQPAPPWAADCLFWLRGRGFLTSRPLQPA
jgi:acetyl esterase/lipase